MNWVGYLCNNDETKFILVYKCSKDDAVPEYLMYYFTPNDTKHSYKIRNAYLIKIYKCQNCLLLPPFQYSRQEDME